MKELTVINLFRKTWIGLPLMATVMAGCNAAKPPDMDPATAQKLADAVKNAAYIDHYFYFPNRSDADTAYNRLKERGWQLQPVRMGADDKNWLVLARQPGPVKELADLHDELDRFAKELHGEYDGWEVPASPDAEKK